MAPMEVRRRIEVTAGKGLLTDLGMVAGTGITGAGSTGVDRLGAISSVSFTSDGVGKEPVGSLGIVFSIAIYLSDCQAIIFGMAEGGQCASKVLGANLVGQNFVH